KEELADGASRRPLCTANATYDVAVQGGFNLLDVVRTSQLHAPVRVEASARRKQFGAVVLAELSAEGIDGNVDYPAVGLKLNLAHNIRGGLSQGLAELVEVFEVRLVEGVTDDLDVHLIEVLRRQAVHELFPVAQRPRRSRRSAEKTPELTKRRVDEHSAVQFLDVGGNAQGGHGVEDADRVAPLQQFVRVALVQSPRDEEDDIVDHISIAFFFWRERRGANRTRRRSRKSVHAVSTNQPGQSAAWNCCAPALRTSCTRETLPGRPQRARGGLVHEAEPRCRTFESGDRKSDERTPPPPPFPLPVSRQHPRPLTGRRRGQTFQRLALGQVDIVGVSEDAAPEPADDAWREKRRDESRWFKSLLAHDSAMSARDFLPAAGCGPHPRGQAIRLPGMRLLPLLPLCRCVFPAATSPTGRTQAPTLTLGVAVVDVEAVWTAAKGDDRNVTAEKEEAMVGDHMGPRVRAHESPAHARMTVMSDPAATYNSLDVLSEVDRQAIIMKGAKVQYGMLVITGTCDDNTWLFHLDATPARGQGESEETSVAFCGINAGLRRSACTPG
ncbi:MAG: hypothetical protein BJ554DRAFT_1467, partial [Olpidium bornovanus]